MIFILYEFVARRAAEPWTFWILRLFPQIAEVNPRIDEQGQRVFVLKVYALWNATRTKVFEEFPHCGFFDFPLWVFVVLFECLPEMMPSFISKGTAKYRRCQIWANWLLQPRSRNSSKDIADLVFGLSKKAQQKIRRQKERVMSSLGRKEFRNKSSKTFCHGIKEP